MSWANRTRIDDDDDEESLHDTLEDAVRQAILDARAIDPDEDDGDVAICRPDRCPFGGQPFAGAACTACLVIKPDDPRSIEEILAAWKTGH